MTDKCLPNTTYDPLSQPRISISTYPKQKVSITRAYLSKPKPIPPSTQIRPPVHPLPPPPLPHPTIHLRNTNPIPDQIHNHAQPLHIAIPQLIIEKQHLVIHDPARLVQLPKMQRLVPRENLHKLEKVERALLGGSARGG